MACPVVIQQLARIASSDGKVKWEVERRNRVLVDGQEFVKLPRSACGFAKLVFHKCEHVPIPLPKGYSLTASSGYDELVKLRNKKQAEVLVAADLESVPALFKDNATAQPKRHSRTDIRDMRSRPATIELRINDPDGGGHGSCKGPTASASKR